MNDLSALRLQQEWGADEALEAAPVDRFAARAARPLAGQPDTSAEAEQRPAERASAAILPMAQAAPAAPTLPPPVALAQSLAAAARSVEELHAALAAFTGCALRATATQTVFADGNPQAGLVFVGEAPGAEEDRSGRPFVGPAGQFLDRMLASIGLTRADYLITNVVPWRPPGNRNPTEQEIQACLPFLLRHIALLRPRRLVLLGKMSSNALTGSTQGITRLRGNWMPAPIPGLDEPIPALPMLHPAYLLRQPGAKRQAWADLITLRRALDADAGVLPVDPRISVPP